MKIKKDFKLFLVCIAISVSGLTYSQFTYTFTNAGITGRFGPSQAQVNSAYATTNLNGSVNVATQGIQSWTVPITGPYRIEASGAKGGNHNNGTFGGYGAKIQGDFILTAGTVLNIIVGQQGQTGTGNISAGGGGGGASFVWINNQTITPLIAAGGGGGGFILPGGSGTITTNGSNASNGGGLGGTSGNPGAGGGGCAGGGGGGWNNGNAPPLYSCIGQETQPVHGQGFSNLFIGGGMGHTHGAAGGFGGGGGVVQAGGGAGGYSGGGGGSQNNLSVSGGGGSYNAGSNQINTSGFNVGEGKVIISLLFSINIIQTNSISCSGYSTAALSSSLYLGTSPISYTWLPSGGNSSTASNLPAGIYTLIAQDANNNISIRSYTITQPTLLSSTVVAQNSVNCFGANNGSATLTSSGGVAPYSYTWSPNGGNLNSALGLGAGTYTIFVKDANNCPINYTINIAQPAPFLNVTSNNSIICIGNSVAITATGANSYTFSGGISNNVAFSPTTSTTYTISGLNTLTGCINNAVLTISVNSLPNVSASANPSIICFGNSIILNGFGANTYSWTNGFPNAFAFYPTSSTIYTLTGTSTLTGCSKKVFQPVIVNPLPTLSTNGNLTICAGESTTISVNGANTYTWSNNSTSTSVILSPSITTAYSVTGTNTNNCNNTNVIMVYVTICSNTENSIFSETEIKFFPNPTNGLLNLEITQFQSSIIYVLNSLGQVIHNQTAENINLLDFRDFENGIYFIHVNKNNKSIYRSKIIKQ